MESRRNLKLAVTRPPLSTDVTLLGRVSTDKPSSVESTPKQLNQSLPGVRPDEFTGEFDSEAEVAGEPASPASIHVQGELPEDSADQDLSEDANYRGTIRGVRSFMGWHQIPDYDHALASLDDNPFASSRCSLPSARASRTFSQDTLRRWERAFREQSMMCNQAAGLSRCLTKVQDSMVTQLKSLRVDTSKGKAAERT